MRAWLAIGMLVLPGCDQLFSLDELQPPPDAPVCPLTYQAAPGANQLYRYGQIPHTWQDAENDCEDDLPGATHLVTFDDLSELEAVRALVTNVSSYNLYAGYARDTVAAGGNPEVFYAVTGESIESGTPGFALWYDTEPNNVDGVETVAFFESVVPMRDGDPTRPQPYICECDGRRVTRSFTLQ